MTDLDLSKYEGAENGCALGVIQGRHCPRCRVKRDALLLLAEVRRLRVELDELRDGVEAAGLEYREDDGPASYWRNTPALDAEHELRALRQSHARLLAAIKADIEHKTSPELRAAVAEAEALNGE